MAGANITMGVTGIDKTGAAFNSIKNRARATGAQIRSIMGGAIAAAGAYLSLRSIKGGIEELGNLSDMAMKAGTSVEALTQSSLAFQVAGLNMPVESLAKSFQYLKKQTGEGGMDHFYKTLESISKIDDAAERGAALVKNFGRSGLELQPLVDGGEEAARKMRELAGVMPGISTSAANAGDEASDALTIFGKGVHDLFLKVVGKICEWWGVDFPGGVRAGALNAISAIEWFIKTSFEKMTRWGARLGILFEEAGFFLFDGYTFEQAVEEYNNRIDFLETDSNNRLAEIDAQREAYKAKLEEANIDDLSNALQGRAADAIGEEIGAAAAKAATRISNQLITGNSNAAQRLSILGPNYQNEQKKQTSILEKIEKNTAKSADNAESETYAATDLT